MHIFHICTITEKKIQEEYQYQRKRKDAKPWVRIQSGQILYDQPNHSDIWIIYGEASYIQYKIH